jgi:hypothetical protein
MGDHPKTPKAVVSEDSIVNDEHEFLVTWPSGARWRYVVNSYHARKAKKKGTKNRAALYLKKYALRSWKSGAGAPLAEPWVCNGGKPFNHTGSWRCHSCEEVRPANLIHVKTVDTSDRYQRIYGRIQESFRYCNDKPECLEAALKFNGLIAHDESQRSG